MTPETKIHVRMQILETLAAQGPLGMPEEILLRDARMKINPGITAPELEAILREHADKRWIVSFSPLIGSPRWRITSLGESAAQEAGCA